MLNFGVKSAVKLPVAHIRLKLKGSFHLKDTTWNFRTESRKLKLLNELCWKLFDISILKTFCRRTLWWKTISSDANNPKICWISFHDQTVSMKKFLNHLEIINEICRTQFSKEDYKLQFSHHFKTVEQIFLKKQNILFFDVMNLFVIY